MSQALHWKPCCWDLTDGLPGAKFRGHFSVIDSDSSALLLWWSPPSFIISRTIVCSRATSQAYFFSLYLHFFFLVLVLIGKSSPGARPQVSFMYTIPLHALCYHWNAEGRGKGAMPLKPTDLGQRSLTYWRLLLPIEARQIQVYEGVRGTFCTTPNPA